MTISSETSEGPPILPPPVVAFRRRGHPLLVWLVIGLTVAAILAAHWFQTRKGDEKQGGEKQGGEPGPGLVTDMQGRYLVGLHELLPANSPDINRQAAVLDAGPVEQRLRYVILVGELDGPAKASEQLNLLQRQWAAEGIHLTTGQERANSILHRLYSDYAIRMMDPLSVDDKDRTWLRAKLGWWGELALAPKDTPDTAAREAVLGAARRTTAVVLGMATGVLLLLLVGSGGLICLMALLVQGKLRGHFHAGTAAGGIYAETFAAWIVLYMGLTLAINQLPLGKFRLLVLGLVMLGSLAALGWPVARGLSWRQVRQEIGWTRGSRPVLEPFLGIGCYAMGIPMLAVGVVLTLLLIRLEAGWKASGGHPITPGGMPTHPMAEAVVHFSWWGRAQLLILASVLAPLVEETVFRGVLYRHLREATGRWTWPISVGVSALVVSFVFAVIHPQGWTAVPALMALAFAFTLAREWRGTLIPAMVAHGINNGVVFTLILLVA